MSRKAGWFVLPLLALALSGCNGGLEATPIKTLLDDPGHYDHQTVRISGEVTQSLGLFGYGAYQVNDGSGGIAVVAEKNGAPRQGTKVAVEGEFRSAYTIGAETAAVILEKKRASP